MASRLAIPVTLNKAAVTVSPGTVSAVTVKLVSVTVTGLLPSNFVIVRPLAALAAGVMAGLPYCVTAGTLVIPFVNPTAADVAVSATTFDIIAL